MDEYNQRTIPVLVDLLTNYLKNLTEKINSFSPILDNIHETMIKNSQDIHDLNSKIENFKNACDSVKEIEKEINKLKDAADTISEQLAYIKSTAENVNQKVSPVAKISNILATPMGFAIFIIAVISSILAIVKLLQQAHLI